MNLWCKNKPFVKTFYKRLKSRKPIQNEVRISYNMAATRTSCIIWSYKGKHTYASQGNALNGYVDALCVICLKISFNLNISTIQLMLMLFGLSIILSIILDSSNDWLTVCKYLRSVCRCTSVISAMSLTVRPLAPRTLCRKLRALLERTGYYSPGCFSLQWLFSWTCLLTHQFVKN